MSAGNKMGTRAKVAIGVALAGGIGGLGYALTRRGRGKKPEETKATVLPDSVARPQKPGGVPFAEGVASPEWPVRPAQRTHANHGVVSYQPESGKTIGRWARRFGSSRSDGSRHHAGVDLFGYAGDLVVAIAPGVVTAVQSFHLGSWAIFVDHGPFVVMYGEVARDSWREFGLSVGDKVGAGDPVARIACMVTNDDGDCVSHMLHLETYTTGTTKNQRWYRSPPAALLNPTMMLLLAAQRAFASGPNVA